jgi:hypothetical protein
VAAAGNRILTRQYEGLRDRHQRIAAATLARDPARRERFLDEHRAIAAALERATATRPPRCSASISAARTSSSGAGADVRTAAPAPASACRTTDVRGIAHPPQLVSLAIS